MNSAAKIKIKTCSAFWGSFQTFEEDKRGHQLVKTRAKPENQKPKTVSQTVKSVLDVEQQPRACREPSRHVVGGAAGETE